MHKRNTSRWLAVVILLSGVLIAVAFALFEPTEKGQYWVNFGSAVATVIALVWLIFGYWTQTAELSLQREELSLQRKEMKKSNEELAAQARALEVQSEAIKVQAELARQSAVISARREFEAELAVRLVDYMRSLVKLDRAKWDYRHYGIGEDIDQFASPEALWMRLNRGERDAFFAPATAIFQKMSFMIEEFGWPLPNPDEYWSEHITDFLLDFLSIAGRYSEAVSSLQAERYDPKPFSELGYAVWNVVTTVERYDDHGLGRNDAHEEPDLVSGPEWVRRSNRPHVKDGIRYLLTPDRIGQELSVDLLRPYDRPPGNRDKSEYLTPTNWRPA